MAYRGRFAPTPSGPLHLGSLMTALASWLDARHHGGAWLLRIDDLDAPRCRPEHASTIMRQLEAYGLTWDEAPRFQSQHLAEYEAAFERLRAEGVLYACGCSRERLQRTGRPGLDDSVYDGACRRSRPDAAESVAWRLALPPGPPSVIVEDWLTTDPRDRQMDIGDFILRRRDGQIAYPLACVIDESAMGISHVVRGADLIGSSHRQQLLLEHLGLPAPFYRHVPVLGGANGRKLSKQNHATPLDANSATESLRRCLGWLGQDINETGSPSELLDRAAHAWRPRFAGPYRVVD